MTDVIGKKLSEATSILTTEGYEVEVIEAISDKQKQWDAMIVIRQRSSNNKIEITVSNFKLEI